MLHKHNIHLHVLESLIVILPELLLLFFSIFQCFLGGFGAFSTFQYRVKDGTYPCNLGVISKLETYLIFISGVVVHLACHY